MKLTLIGQKKRRKTKYDPQTRPICCLHFWSRPDPEYLAHIVDWLKQWPTEIYRLILQRKTTFFAIIIAICNVECPTLSNTVHSKSRRRKLFVVGYRFQQTEEWCGREVGLCYLHAPLPMEMHLYSQLTWRWLTVNAHRCFSVCFTVNRNLRVMEWTYISLSLSVQSKWYI